MSRERFQTTAVASRSRWAWAFSTLLALLALLALAGCDAPGRSAAPHAPTQPAPSMAAQRAYYAYPTAATAPSGAPIPTGGALLALDARTGTIAWRSAIHTPLFQPVEAHGVVYASSYTDDPRTSWLDALDPQTGKPLWSHQTSGTFNNPLVVAGGAIYVTTEEQNAQGEFNGVLQALDEQSGALRWTFPVAEAPSPATVVGGTVYLSGAGSVFGSSALYALDTATGKTRWSYTSAALLSTQDPSHGYPDAQLAPLASGGRVVVISTIRDSHGFALQSAQAFDAATGAPRWSYSTGGLVGAPVVANGTLYLSASIQTGNVSQSFVAALRMSDGSVLWRQGARPGNTLITGMVFAQEQGGVGSARLLVAENTSAPTSENAALVALAPDTGRTLWMTTIGQQAAEGPLLAAGLALMQVTVPAPGSRTALRLLTVRPSDGRIRWSQDDGDSTAFDHTMWLLGDSVVSVMAMMHGNAPTISLLALRLSDGARQWQVKPQ